MALSSSLLSKAVSVLQELQFIGCSTYEKHSLLLLFCLWFQLKLKMCSEAAWCAAVVRAPTSQPCVVQLDGRMCSVVRAEVWRWAVKCALRCLWLALPMVSYSSARSVISVLFRFRNRCITLFFISPHLIYSLF